MKTIKYFFQSIFIYIFFIIAKLIGLTLSRIMFSLLFRNLGPLIKSEKIINKNFEKFSKNITENQKKLIISNMWSNYGKTFIEYIFLKKFKSNNSHINIEGEDILNKIFENNKPVIFISGHFANFELMSMEITKRNIKLATIYRPLNNFFLNPLMEFLRKKYICKYQIKKGLGGVKESIKYINKGYSVALMIDQRVSEGEKIKFFEHEALTTTLPAQLAIKFNLNIVPIFIERNKNNIFNIKVHDPVETINYNKKNLSEELNKILERMIEKNPNQWIWTHDRWK